MKLGFIGFGEVSFEMSCGLKTEGLSGIVAFDPLTRDPKFREPVNKRAAEAGVELLLTACDVVEYSDVVIAAVPGNKALEAALNVVNAVKKGQIYVDVSTSAAPTKQKIAEAVEAKGASFVDGAMMGPLSVQRHKVPILLSGSGSDKFIEMLSPYKMSLEKVSDNPGDAISVKLVRSVYMKGIASLAVEMLEAATKLKVDDLVLKSISDTVNANPFVAMLDWLMPATAIHAKRQAHEMVDVTSMLKEIGVTPTMTEATMKRLEWLADKKLKDKFKDKKPGGWAEVAAAWSDE